MAQPHAYSQPIEPYGLAPHNRNIWPYNSQAAAASSRLADSFVCPSSCGLPTTKFSLNCSLGVCPGVLSRRFLSIPPSVRVNLLQQKGKHHCKLHVSYV